MSYENICYKCKKKIEGLSFRCSYCHRYHCDEHRLPEEHECKELERYRKRNPERWKRAIRQEFSTPKSYTPPSYKNISSKDKQISHKERSESFKIKKSYVKILFVVLLVSAFIVILLASGGMHYIFAPPLNCSDGTFYNRCSNAKPFYCNNGSLVRNASHCGCSYDFKPNGNNCERIQRCSDRTIYGECSTNQPLYCSGGSLIQNATFCGCLTGQIIQGDNCISQYQTNGKSINFNYVLNGQQGNINYRVYSGLNDYLASLPRSITYTEGESVPTTSDFIMRDLNQQDQLQMVSPLVQGIQNTTANTDNQVRIAISLVQNIPYGSTSNLAKYPYEVLYTNLGVCGEKSELLALILKDLGYGVAIFNYQNEDHETVGIKCPVQYSLNNTGYCFIETTDPSIITDSNGYYPCTSVNGGTITTFISSQSRGCKLGNDYTLIPISDGKSFDSVSQEYNDAQTLENLNAIGDQNNNYLSESQYNQWEALVQKYGIQTA